MLIESYKEALKKRENVILKLWRMRFVVLAAALLLIAGAVMLGITGTVYDDSYSPAVVYGQKLTPSSKAIFKNTTYEYRAEGGEWSSEEPILPGKYEFRAVSESVAGKKRYGEAHAFSIDPAPLVVKITDPTLMYGATPSYAAEGLQYGDALTVENFLFEKIDYTAFNISADVSALKITDSDGNDVSNFYSVTAEAKAVLTDLRPIKIRTGSDAWVYDGKPHTCDDFSIISEMKLLSGHSMTIECEKITDVSQIPNRLEKVRVVDENGEDVTPFYEVDSESGTLTVTTRQVEITTATRQFIYNGTPQSYAGFTSSGLAEGHVLTGSAADVPTVTAVAEGAKENRFAITPYVSDGVSDVTANYTFVYRYGAISVAKANISVAQTGEKTFVYDGSPKQYSDNLNSDPLPEGQEITAEFSEFTEITDDPDSVKFIDNSFTCKVTETESGEDMSENYNINIISVGKIRIKSPVEIRPFANVKYYDGTQLTVGAKDFEIIKLPPDVRESDVEITLSGSLTDAGEITLDELKSSATISVHCPGENRVDFVGADAPIKVLPRDIEISSASITSQKPADPADQKTLDGNIGKDAYWIAFGSLVDGHKLTATVSGKLTPDKTAAKNTISSFSIQDATGKDVTKNYKVTLKEGTLKWIS